MGHTNLVAQKSAPERGKFRRYYVRRSSPYRLALYATSLLLAFHCDAATSDLYTVINRLRAGEGDCAITERLPPLKPQPALEGVAKDLARGTKLQESLKAAGYGAARSSALSIKGDRVGARAAEMLAKPSYCRQLQDAAMKDIGVYQDDRQVWIVMAAPFAVEMSERAAGRRVLELVNQARATPRTCGKTAYKPARPLRWNDSLAEASRRHAEDMARHNYFSHRGRDGSDPAQRVERAGYRYRSTGENISAGQTKPDEVVAKWIKSSEHCANLMNPAFTEMGVAFAINPRSEMGVYWTQVFGRPRRSKRTCTPQDEKNANSEKEEAPPWDYLKNFACER